MYRRPVFWHDPQELKQIAAEGSSAFYPGKKKLVQSANWAKKVPNPSDTDKKMVPAGESPQDYRSLAIYYWPDESRPGGLPYKNHMAGSIQAMIQIAMMQKQWAG